MTSNRTTYTCTAILHSSSENFCRRDFYLPWRCLSRRCVRAAIDSSATVEQRRGRVTNCSAVWNYPNADSPYDKREWNWALSGVVPESFLSLELTLYLETQCSRALQRQCSSASSIWTTASSSLRNTWLLAFHGQRWTAAIGSALSFLDLFLITPLGLAANVLCVVLMKRVLEVSPSVSPQ